MRYKNTNVKPWIDRNGRIIWSQSRIFVAKIVRGQVFETFMGIVILLNIVLLERERELFSSAHRRCCKIARPKDFSYVSIALPCCLFKSSMTIGKCFPCVSIRTCRSGWWLSRQMLMPVVILTMQVTYCLVQAAVPRFHGFKPAMLFCKSSTPRNVACEPLSSGRAMCLSSNTNWDSKWIGWMVLVLNPAHFWRLSLHSCPSTVMEHHCNP